MGRINLSKLPQPSNKSISVKINPDKDSGYEGDPLVLELRSLTALDITLCQMDASRSYAAWVDRSSYDDEVISRLRESAEQPTNPLYKLPFAPTIDTIEFAYQLKTAQVNPEYSMAEFVYLLMQGTYSSGLLSLIPRLRTVAEEKGTPGPLET